MFVSEVALDGASPRDLGRDLERTLAFCADRGAVAADPRRVRSGRPEPSPEPPRAADLVALARKRRFRDLGVAAMRRLAPSRPAAALLFGAERRWRRLYERLADDLSRHTLLSVLAFRALGPAFAPLPRDPEAHWDAYEAAGARLDRATEDETLRVDATTLRYMDFAEFGFDIKMYTDAKYALYELIDPQYQYQGGATIEPEPGDVAIDAGGCWGGATLYFAHAVGPTGRVLSFEFLPSNLEIFQKNLDANPALKERVTLIEAPLWSRPGDPLYIHGAGTSAYVSGRPSKDGRRTSTDTIEAAVSRSGVETVDFVKMDIEGAEIAALKGSAETLAAHRPKLAISVYHRLSDFYEIPELIDRLAPGYDFRLQHRCAYEGETILFASR